MSNIILYPHQEQILKDTKEQKIPSQGENVGSLTH